MEIVSSIVAPAKDAAVPQPGQDLPHLTRQRASVAKQGRGSWIEHRLGSRHRVMMLVKVHKNSGRCTAGLLYNLSADGMFVLSEEPPLVNKCVDIEFALSPAGNMAVTIKGIVVHRRKTGFGLMFREPDDPALDLLDACLQSTG
jgi:hypothetical protein